MSESAHGFQLSARVRRPHADLSATACSATRRLYRVLPVLACGLCCVGGLSRAAPPPPELLIAVYAYLDDDTASSSTALADKLRSCGVEAHERLLAIGRLLEQERNQADGMADRVTLTSRIQKLDRLADEVASQKWSTVSELFWHRELDFALTTARELHRPVLSLRVEGSLVADDPPAEIALLIATLLCNRDVAQELQNRFVLHWQQDMSASLRSGSLQPEERSRDKHESCPPPYLAHFILNGNGVPIAALTRLANPACYLKWLRDYARLADGREADSHDLFQETRRAHRAARNERREILAAAVRGAVDDASLIELQRSFARPVDDADTIPCLSPDQWRQVYAALSPDVFSWELDARSLALVRSDSFGAWAKRGLPIALTPPEIQQHVRAETIRSQFLDLRVIDDWFCQSSAALDLELLNARIYRTFFVTGRK